MSYKLACVEQFTSLRYLCQGILKGQVSLYRWPPVWLVWNQLYDNWQILFLFAQQTNPNQSNRRSVVQWYFPLYVSRSPIHHHLFLQLLRNQFINGKTADVFPLGTPVSTELIDRIFFITKFHSNPWDSLPFPFSLLSIYFPCTNCWHAIDMSERAKGISNSQITDAPNSYNRTVIIRVYL